MKFENRVQRSRHLLTKMDKKIIEFIRTNELDDRFSTINSLAHAIGTSPATITRFSNKLEYHNFQDMKFNLQHLAKKSQLSLHNIWLLPSETIFHVSPTNQTRHLYIRSLHVICPWDFPKIINEYINSYGLYVIYVHVVK